MRTRIKFCGITRIEDAIHAAQVGADAIGLIFALASARRVSVDQARVIAQELPPLVSRVALFMDNGAAEIDEVLTQVSVDLVQFHGREDGAFCRAFGKPYLKVVPMRDVVDVGAYAQAYPDAAGFVLDAHGVGEAGGSGQRFDWTRVPQALARPIVLAGGLTPDNVAAAISTARPYAVDVSSGVETSPGIKDHEKMQRFFDEVRRVGG